MEKIKENVEKIDNSDIEEKKRRIEEFISTYPNYPSIKGNYCCADSNTSFVIDFEGYMYKCWNDVGNSGSSVGNVNDPAMDSANDKCGRWLCRKLPDRCRNCNILPICAGGCPHVTNVLHKPNACDFIRYNIEETMLEYYRRFSRNMR